jgi:hypothetical protein
MQIVFYKYIIVLRVTSGPTLISRHIERAYSSLIHKTKLLTQKHIAGI